VRYLLLKNDIESMFSIMTLRQQLYINFLKRPIDFFGALLTIIVISPLLLGVMALLLFANKNGIKGIFFIQNRPGKKEKIFKAIKFKTMTDERDANGILLPDDKRLTKVGRFVRSTSIDELPQLINILKGDMAFIGPRPLLVQYLPLYSEKQHHRHDVTPGMSGWAQVNGRNNISWSKKFELDLYYVQNISFKLDIQVFFMTIKKVFLREDINQEVGLWGTMDPFNGTN